MDYLSGPKEICTEMLMKIFLLEGKYFESFLLISLLKVCKDWWVKNRVLYDVDIFITSMSSMGSRRGVLGGHYGFLMSQMMFFTIRKNP